MQTLCDVRRYILSVMDFFCMLLIDAMIKINWLLADFSFLLSESYDRELVGNQGLEKGSPT